MRRPTTQLAALLAFLICAALSVVAGFLVLHGSDDQHRHVTVSGQRVALTSDQALGHQVFAEHCAACHQLAASNSDGATGPDLDAVQPSAAEVRQVVENGQVSADGDMPAGLATGPQLSAVASYVARVANRHDYHP